MTRLSGDGFAAAVIEAHCATDRRDPASGIHFAEAGRARLAVTLPKAGALVASHPLAGDLP